MRRTEGPYNSAAIAPILNCCIFQVKYAPEGTKIWINFIMYSPSPGLLPQVSNYKNAMVAGFRKQVLVN